MSSSKGRRIAITDNDYSDRLELIKDLAYGPNSRKCRIPARRERLIFPEIQNVTRLTRQRDALQAESLIRHFPYLLHSPSALRSASDLDKSTPVPDTGQMANGTLCGPVA